MKEKNRNDQLERFFQHNPIEDPLYLKKYVKEHPDHKMAWYLLGREYAAQGKEGKAAYCFAQSGEIYEAFERQKITIDGPMPSALTSTLQSSVVRTTTSKSSGKGKWLPLLVMLLLLAIPAAMDLAKEDVIGASYETLVAPSPAVVPAPVIQEGSSGLKLYFSNGDWGRKLQQVLPSSGKGESVIMEVPRSADGKWNEWNKSVRPLISVIGGVEGTSALKYYQSQICSCEAADSADVVPVIANWMRDREQAIVLQSTIQAFQQKTGALPDKPEQLTKPYPDNLLPGLSPEMRELFPQAVNMQIDRTKAGKLLDPKQTADESVYSKQEPRDQSPPGNLQPKASAEPLREALKIVIDTDMHRLALVSGDFIIRIYPVGLGGEKTPQGEFIISEKVRNPNGKSNGEFGSRGMTLSDTLYAIHGTNKPSSIGKDESHGCVRMQQADVEELYNMVPHETKVIIGKGLLPSESVGGTGSGSGSPGLGAGRGQPDQSFGLPLQTNDSNPDKKYKWLD